jgi:hypothetical protein
LLCVSVTLNGVPLAIAGAPTAESIEASVGFYPGFNEAWLRIVGTILPEGQPPADAHWPGSPLNVGDVVELQLIHSAEPTPPRLGRVDPNVKGSDEIPFFCAFCSKPAVEVEGMMAGARAMICNGCVRELYGMLDDRDSTV